ncbi:MAG TPA: hypothetical protein VNK25_01005 [Candidatus Nitrosotenuis sp.]|jgi:hypothetical protein|nr:hypothetical protein [Candidatus Nitrosotenuis sp.]
MEKAALCLNNNCYNVIHQLSKTLGFLSRVDQYIVDAQKVGDKESEKVWNTIKSDRQKHAELLRNLVVNEIKNAKF